LGLDADSGQLTVSQAKELITESKKPGRCELASFQPSGMEETPRRSKQQSSVAKKAILATRVALIKMDSLIMDASSEEEDTLHGLPLAEGQDLHLIIDEIRRWKVGKKGSRQAVSYVWVEFPAFEDAARVAFSISRYAPHLQRFPSIAVLISSSVGVGFPSSRA
jgi:hypothetical protein